MNSTGLSYGVPLPDLITAATDEMNSNYIVLAITALVAYDHFLTLPAEISEIWGSPFSGASALFLTTRYTLVAFFILYDTYILRPDMRIRACQGMWTAIDALSIIPFITLPMIWILRTYAIWGRSIVIPLILIPLLAGRLTATIYVYFVGQKASVVPSYLHNNAPLCSVSLVNGFQQWSAATGFMALSFDFMVFFLTILRTLKWAMKSRAHGVKSNLHGLILRDGSLFFGFIAALNIMFICTRFVKNTPVVFASYMAFINCGFELVVTNRLILNLRNMARSRNGVATETRTDLAFYVFSSEARPRTGMDSILGNLGQSMRMYGDDDEGDGWPLEKIPESPSEGTTINPTDNSHDTSEVQSFDAEMAFRTRGVAI